VDDKIANDDAVHALVFVVPKSADDKPEGVDGENQDATGENKDTPRLIWEQREGRGLVGTDKGYF